MAGLNSLAELSSRVIDRLESEYGDECVVRTSAFLVEIDGDAITHLLVMSTEDRSWVQIAFVERALISLEKEADRLELADDDD